MSAWKIVILASAGFLFFSLGTVHSYHAGFEAAERKQQAFKAKHDTFMRGIGTCRWAALMAKEIMCQKQPENPPPVPWELGTPG